MLIIEQNTYWNLRSLNPAIGRSSLKICFVVFWSMFFFYPKHIKKLHIIHEILIIDLFCRISLISKWIPFLFSNNIGSLDLVQFRIGFRMFKMTLCTLVSGLTWHLRSATLISTWLISLPLMGPCDYSVILSPNWTFGLGRGTGPGNRAWQFWHNPMPPLWTRRSHALFVSFWKRPYRL